MRDREPGDRSQALRLRLAAVGINLDEPSSSTRTRAETAATNAPIDRDAIRRILLERGAPAKDLDWLTASCPSELAARAYTVPAFPRAAAPPDPKPEPGCLECQNPPCARHHGTGAYTTPEQPAAAAPKPRGFPLAPKKPPPDGAVG
jgi:hypothetical protein